MVPRPHDASRELATFLVLTVALRDAAPPPVRP